MRLVGGSNWHVRAPFLIEGGLYGIFAAAIALVVFYPLIYLVSPKIEALMPSANLMGYFVANSMQYVGMVLFAGIFLGVVSSAIAIRRFLRV